MQESLKKVLSQIEKHRINDASRVASAVLIPVFYKQGEYHVLFTKRTNKVKDHKGQISFPGGAYEKEDESLENTALRECSEEIGLAAEAVEVLGELDDLITMHTEYVISPFIGTIPWPYPLKVDPTEVDKIIEVPISALLDKDCLRQDTDPLNDGKVYGNFYYYQGEIIWGATARILSQFLDVWVEAMGG